LCPPAWLPAQVLQTQVGIFLPIKDWHSTSLSAKKFCGTSCAGLPGAYVRAGKGRSASLPPATTSAAKT
jgi:hypothetical protein